MDASQRKIVTLPNKDLYDAWSATYDADGNMLQALDTFALDTTMFTRLFQAVIDLLPALEDGDDPWYITDLGCGTGRATMRLLAALRFNHADLIAKIAAKHYQTIMLVGVDSSQGMLNIARDRVPAFASVGDTHVLNTEFGQYDIFDDDPEGRSQPPTAHVIMSTLVLEHLPLELFFRRAESLLFAGGLLMLTNMHPDMGNATFETVNGSDAAGATPPKASAATQAGFIDAEINTKYRGTSYVHSLADVQSAAEAAGFKMIGPVEERRVESWMFGEQSAQGQAPLIGPRGAKWEGTNCWFGMLFQLEA